MVSPPVVLLTISGREFAEYVLWRDMYLGLHRAGIAAASIDTTVGSIPVDAIVRNVDGVILGGGGDVDPILYGGDAGDEALTGVDSCRDRNEIAIFNRAANSGLPVLGICRGLQVINVARSGTLFGDVLRDLSGALLHRGEESRLHEPLHSVQIDHGSRLAALLGTSGPVEVNSGHHQGIRRLGSDLVVSARSDDGLVEGIESSRPDDIVFGVQWHPENLWRTQGHAASLLESFGRLCSR